MIILILFKSPIRPVTLNGGFEMNAWFDILGLRPDANQDEDGIKNSSQLRKCV